MGSRRYVSRLTRCGLLALFLAAIYACIGVWVEPADKGHFWPDILIILAFFWVLIMLSLVLAELMWAWWIERKVEGAYEIHSSECWSECTRFARIGPYDLGRLDMNEVSRYVVSTFTVADTSADRDHFAASVWPLGKIFFRVYVTIARSGEYLECRTKLRLFVGLPVVDLGGLVIIVLVTHFIEGHPLRRSALPLKMWRTLNRAAIERQCQRKKVQVGVAFNRDEASLKSATSESCRS